MAFHDRRYDFYVMLGTPDIAPIWAEPGWSRVAALIDPLIEKARGAAAVRSLQLRPGAGSPGQRAIAFGRMGWNAKGHGTWVHRGPGQEADDAPRQFVNAEIWAPSWTMCGTQNRPPDMYLALRNEKTWREEVTFNPVVMLAVAKDGGMAERGRASAIELAKAVGAKFRAYRERPWARLGPGGGVSDAINDLLVTGLFVAGAVHGQPVLPALLKGEWGMF